MTAFEWMSDQQLENVIEYITKWELPAPTEGGGGLLPCIPEQKKEEDSYLIVLFGVIGLSLLIILIFTGCKQIS